MLSSVPGNDGETNEMDWWQRTTCGVDSGGVVVRLGAKSRAEHTAAHTTWVPLFGVPDAAERVITS